MVKANGEQAGRKVPETPTGQKPRTPNAGFLLSCTRMTQPVLKKDVVAELFKDGRSFNFESLEASARRIVEQARIDADAQIARAKAEIDKLRAEIRGQEFETARKEGFDKGFEEGRGKGLENGRQEAHKQHLDQLTKATATLPQMLQGMLNEVNSRHESVIQSAERDLLALAFAIAERLTRLRVESDPTAVLGTLRSAIELTLNRSTLDVFASPADIAAIGAHLPELRKAFTDLGAVRLHADESVGQGGVVVKTGRGEVSMKISELIDTIAHELLGTTAEAALARAKG